MTKNVDVDNTMRKSPPNRLPRVGSKTLGAEPKKKRNKIKKTIMII